MTGRLRAQAPADDNQRGDNIAVFRVDRKRGGLHFTGHYVPVGNPSMLVFLDLAKAA